ncbi:hypothetical protein LS73_008780 [Helicobacter muridarum]|uniref:Uncharacterized protein n=1 Tax=Helicobacter muridarum TaxID=216 RepID=A0A377PWB5_9HELI|nr:hypothetical protein [Helicobacter muridarum]TLD98511.1 hypothetical protein LS73_008780 [Helicobacter muridarum]STQ86810.1 Uncharacterised protein [Helicobacter muridarum]
MKDFEVVICLQKLDSPLFSTMIEYVKAFIKPKDISIITHKTTIMQYKQSYPDICFIDEDSLYPNLNYRAVCDKLLSLGGAANRAGWYFQQFLKMAYAPYSLASSSNGGGGTYLIWDADTIPLVHLEFFNADSQILIEVAREYHKPYFDTLENLKIPINQGAYLHKAAPFSFIAENMMIESSLMNELISLIEQTHQKAFWESILEHINPKDLGASGFSEYESYGNFIYTKYPHRIQATTRKRDRFAKRLIGDNPSESLLQWYKRSYEVIGIEWWDKTSFIYPFIQKYTILRIFPPRFYIALLKYIDRVKSII